MIKLKGMTWKHERGLKPLVEASRIFAEKNNVQIDWDARSLSDFELFPLDELANKYDLIMIDHPHIGIAHEQNLLQPLEKLLSKEMLQEQENGSVGKSYQSYFWEGHQYAIPLDAATQVSAFRKDLLMEKKLSAPITWDDVFSLADKLSSDTKIAIPFVPVHAYSSFFTLCSHFSPQGFWSNNEDLSIETGEKVLGLLIDLLKVSHKDSKNMDPIDMLDRMNTTNEIVYCPLVYGYSNYSRADYGMYPVTFREMPKSNSIPDGSMIGGVGLSISTKCAHTKEAVEFVNMVSAPDFQKSIIFNAGGQPGHLNAWKDKTVNSNSDDFFIGTIETLQNGSMRPRFAGYIDFQAEAGKRIRDFVTADNGSKSDFIEELNALIKKCRANKGLK